MGWIKAVSHTGTGAGWHDPQNAYGGGYAWHDILSGHWSDPGLTDWGDWLLLQFDGTYTSTTVRWYVSWIWHSAAHVGLKLQYTINGDLVSQEVPAFPTLQEITFTERGVSAMGIRYGSGYSIPRNQIEPRIHGPYSEVLTDLLVLEPTGIVSAEAFGTPTIATVEVALGRTYFFLA